MSIIVAFLLSAAAAPEQPAAPSAAPAPTAVPAKPAKEKKICKVDPESDPASHMVKRICRTEQEWNQQGVLGSSRSGFSISGDKMEGH
jgi:pyruvate/2-oxoglutarate dehydrogenase complex dihydrolipoamide acyltransferase (E2) component